MCAKPTVRCLDPDHGRSVVLALYILVLNTRHTANRHVSALLFLFAVNTFALGLMWGSSQPSPVAWFLTSATVTAIEPALFLVAIVLLKPEWMRGPWRWVFWPIYALTLLPIVLTAVDVLLGTQLWIVVRHALKLKLLVMWLQPT